MGLTAVKQVFAQLENGRMRMHGTLVLALLLSGCATLADTSSWVRSYGEPATWVAHSVVDASLITLTDVAVDDPWLGYWAGMGLLVGWELGEHIERTKRGVPHAATFGTVMDLVTPAVTGYLFAKLLEDDDDN